MQEENGILREQFHAILSICYVPPQDVQPAFSYIEDSCDVRLDGVLNHLEDYYILGRRRGRGHRPPRYAIETWNTYELVINGIPRTNSTCEAWNSRFNALLGRYHPNLHLFLDALYKEEQYAESMRRSVDLGEGPPRKKRKYVLNDARIRRIVSRYGEYVDEQEDLDDNDWNGGILKYLRTLGSSSSRIFI